MRVCIEKATGRLIEAQSGGETQEHLDTLLQNAINAGYNEADVEAKFIDDADLPALIESSKTPEQKLAELNAPVKAKLKEVDLKSIRSIREWISKQVAAPKILTDYEAEAISERAKLAK